MACILIVDDSPTQTLTLARMVQRHGHDVITANNGESGVELARRHCPDLVLMDVVMPRLNGFQATRRISNDDRTRHIPIILVTTKDQETDKIWGRRQGASEYLVKPVDETALIEAINRLLAGRP